MQNERTTSNIGLLIAYSWRIRIIYRNIRIFTLCAWYLKFYFCVLLLHEDGGKEKHYYNYVQQSEYLQTLFQII